MSTGCGTKQRLSDESRLQGSAALHGATWRSTCVIESVPWECCCSAAFNLCSHLGSAVGPGAESDFMCSHGENSPGLLGAAERRRQPLVDSDTSVRSSAAAATAAAADAEEHAGDTPPGSHLSDDWLMKELATVIEVCTAR